MRKASTPRLTSSTEPADPPGELVLVGRLGRPHGLRGHLAIVSETDNEERFVPGARVLLRSGEALTVAEHRLGGAGQVIAFVGISDRNQAESLRGSELFVELGERRRLREDEYWPDELVGLEVRDQTGATRGRVEAVDDNAPQTRLVVATSAGTRLVPLVAPLVTEVSLAAGYLVVADIPGLLADEAGVGRASGEVDGDQHPAG